MTLGFCPALCLVFGRSREDRAGGGRDGGANVGVKGKQLEAVQIDFFSRPR